MPNSRSHDRLKQLVERAVADACDFPRPGLWFCVDTIEAHGHPPEHLRIWATLHFLSEGSPFCCGESGCHLGLFGERLEQIGDHVRRALKFSQRITVHFGDRIGVIYHAGVTFRDKQAED